ncbi:cell division protein CrgA [Nonomuraea sp. NPDC049695]|uniref:cell division protein CrgA n=1 Tax=Nonomuraea sp. NPDC049695 TaxID=3154734 RepID=UPI00342BB9F3
MHGLSSPAGTRSRSRPRYGNGCDAWDELAAALTETYAESGTSALSRVVGRSIGADIRPDQERTPAQEGPAEVGRTHPADRHFTVSPRRRSRFWLGTLMWITGIVWAAIYYLAPGEGPLGAFGNLNLLVGFVLVVLGLSLAVRRPSE